VQGLTNEKIQTAARAKGETALLSTCIDAAMEEESAIMSAKERSLSVQTINRRPDEAGKVKVNKCVNEFKGFGRGSGFMFKGFGRGSGFMFKGFGRGSGFMFKGFGCHVFSHFVNSYENIVDTVKCKVLVALKNTKLPTDVRLVIPVLSCIP
jgi:hypothetical protein